MSALKSGQHLGLERTELLSAITKKHTIDLFTHDKAFSMPGLRNHGTVDYYTQMPVIMASR